MSRKTKLSAQHDDVTYIAYPKEDVCFMWKVCAFTKETSIHIRSMSRNNQKSPARGNSIFSVAVSAFVLPAMEKSCR